MKKYISCNTGLKPQRRRIYSYLVSNYVWVKKGEEEKHFTNCFISVPWPKLEKTNKNSTEIKDNKRTCV